MQVSLKKSVFIGFGAAVLILGACLWISYRSATATLESARWVAHTREVLETLDGLLAQVGYAEAAYREFLASGDERPLQTLDSAFQQAPPALARLRALTLDNPAQRRRLDELASLVAQRLVWIQQLVDTRRTRGAEAARQIVSGTVQRTFMSAVHHVVDEMKTAEELLLQQRTATLTQVARRTQVMVLTGTVAALLAVAFAAAQVNRDLRARRRAEQASRDSNEGFQAMVEGVKDYAIFRLDPQGRVATWNAGAERSKGYRADEIIGQHFSRFYPPEDVARGKPEQELRDATAEGRTEDEGWRVRKDGSRFWANAVITALRNRDGALTGFAKVTRDMTERKRGDEALRQYAAQLEVANAELDTFAYSVSHDLRAPLRSIDGFSQALLEDYAERLDDAGRGYLDRVRTATQHMAALIDDLLKLSRIARADLRRERVDLTALARSIMADLQREEPGRTVEFIVAPDVAADGDPHLLRVVLENLLGNAWKYTGKRPEARIEFGVTSHEGQAAYYIRDNGAGFDMAYANKLFGAFQRLHSSRDFEGTGVGLATVQRIIHRHGGRVWADGEVGRGATFYFTL